MQEGLIENYLEYKEKKMPLKTYTTTAEKALPVERLGEILMDFQTTDLPKLKKLGNYYIGKQDILYKEPIDDGRPNHIVIVNYCRQITNTFEGFITGNPVTFNGENLDEVQDILSYNDIQDFCSEFLKSSLIYGRSFAINYIDGEGKQRLALLPSTECIPVYSPDVEKKLLYVIRFYVDTSSGNLVTDEKYRVEVYGERDTVIYASQPGFETFMEIDRQPNYFEQCPVTVFSLNSEEQGIFDPIMTLQNAVNDLMSGSLDSFSDFADAYLVLQGMTADENDLADMKKHRCILLDGEEHCNASFLTKNISDTQVNDILENLNEKIYAIAQCPDFTSPQLFGNASSGVALRYKLLNFENLASTIENRMRKALQRIIELICAILNLSAEEATWRDVEIIFTENLPVDMSETVNLVNALRGVVSQETLLAQLPFIQDAEEELKKLRAEEKETLNIYNLGEDEE